MFGEFVAVATNWAFSLFAALVVLAVLARRDAWRRVVAVTLTGGVAAVVAVQVGRLVKALVAERRPCDVRPELARYYTCPRNFSFPSDHAIYAGALGVTVVVLGRLVGRRAIAGAAVVLALAIGASRVYLGVHYWWDVVAGLAFGAVVAVTAVLLLRAGRTRGPTRRRTADVP